MIGISGNQGLGPRSREKKEATIFKRREELLAHWQSEMTSQERESLRPERVKSETSQNLLEARAAKELALKHLFEHVSLKARAACCRNATSTRPGARAGS